MLAFVIINGIIFAQNYSKATTNIKTKLIEGTSISIVDHRFESGKFSIISPAEIADYKQNEILLRVSGENIGNILFHYGYFKLTEVDSVKEYALEKMDKSSYRIENKDDKEIYFLIKRPNASSESLNNYLYPKICYVSLVYN